MASTDANIEQQVTRNLHFIINNHFLTMGAYDTIDYDEEDFQANEQGLLRYVDDEQYPASGNNYRVWESPYRNWVYESGITPPSGQSAPIIASGVWVDGSFYERDDATYGHFIDYANGRIVFDSPIDVSSEVAASFSFKSVDIKIPNKNDELYMGRIFVMNPETSPYFTQASGYMSGMPKLLIDYNDDESAPIQLGGGRQMNIRILLHVVANDKFMRSYVRDIARWLDRRRFRMIDWGLVSDPIGYNGDLIDPSSGFDLAGLQADTDNFYGLLEFNTMRTRNINNQFRFYQGLLDFNVNVRQLSY